MRAVPRDLLPLPSPVASEPPALRPSGRRSQQRLSRQSAIDSRVREMVWSVNELYGEGQELKGVRPSHAQTTALDRFRRVATEDLPPGPIPAPEAAFQELLGSKGSSYMESTSVAPYCLEKVSWPADAGRASLLQCLPNLSSLDVAEVDLRLRLSPEELAVRQETEGKTRCYWDPALKGDKEVYLFASFALAGWWSFIGVARAGRVSFSWPKNGAN